MANSGKGLFSQEGPFMKYGTLLFDMVLISLLWLAFSGILVMLGILLLVSLLSVPSNWGIPIMILAVLIPVLHIGPATTACFYVMSRRQRNVDTYLWREFWHSYQENYKQGIVLSLILNAVPSLLLFLIYMEVIYAGYFGNSLPVLLGFQLIFVAEALFTDIYVFSMLARFDMTTKDFLRYGFILANKHLPVTLLCVVLLAGFVAVTILLVPLLMLFLPGLYAYLSAALLERVFRNYMPDEDAELEQEEVEGFDLDAERQAIMDRYSGHSASYDDAEASVTFVEPKAEEAAEVTIVQRAEDKKNNEDA
jgi:uncharacterized membrane protein YesL